jgi:ankyrin repeat protein
VNLAKILVKWANDNCTTDDNVHYTPLMFAAAKNDVDLVRVLLEGGASVESTNDYQWTPLHVAAFYGHLEVCRLLLDWGAKVDSLDVSEETPLHHAAMTGHLSVVKLLVEKGANVRIKNGKGHTASDMARSKGFRNVAVWLKTQVL